MDICPAHGFAGFMRPGCLPWVDAFSPLESIDMGFSRYFATGALLCSAVPPYAHAVDVDIPVSALTSEVESDWTSVYYGKTPLLFGNDGSAASGGWLAWDINSTTPLNQVHAETPGRRTKLVTTIHRQTSANTPAGLAVSIGQPDSVLRAWELPGFEEAKSAQTTVLGDWSALCSWKSPGGNDYVYLFGKMEAKVFLVRTNDENGGVIRFLEVRSLGPGCY